MKTKKAIKAQSVKKNNSKKHQESLIKLEKVDIRKVQWTAASAFPCG